MDNIILQINASCELDITVSSNWWISLSSSALLISFFTSADNTIMKLGLDPYVHVLLLIWWTSFSHHLLATQTINWFFFSDPMIDLLSLEKKNHHVALHHNIVLHVWWPAYSSLQDPLVKCKIQFFDIYPEPIVDYSAMTMWNLSFIQNVSPVTEKICCCGLQSLPSGFLDYRTNHRIDVTIIHHLQSNPSCYKSWFFNWAIFNLLKAIQRIREEPILAIVV